MTWALAKLCKLIAIGMNLRNSLKILKGMSRSSTYTPKHKQFPRFFSFSTISSTSISSNEQNDILSPSPVDIPTPENDQISLSNSSSPDAPPDSPLEPSITSPHPPPPASPHDSLCITATGRSILMFWSIFALIAIWEQYFEHFFQWIPLYYYCKSFFILLMSFPQLKFTQNIFYTYLIPFFEWIHVHYANISEFDWINFFLTLPFDILFLFFPFHINTKSSPPSASSVSSSSSKVIQESNYEIIQINENDSYDLSIPIYGDENENEDNEKSEDSMIVEIKEMSGSCSIEVTKTNEKKLENIFQNDEKEFSNNSNPIDENVTLRSKYVTPKTNKLKKRINPFREEENEMAEEEDYISPIPTRQNKSTESSSREKVSPLLNGVRQLLTGDSTSKLRDSVFNFDVYSPNPNTLYRQRHSIIPPPSSAPASAPTPLASSSSSSSSVSTTSTLFREASREPPSLVGNSFASSSLHRVIRSSLPTNTSERRENSGAKKSTRGIKTKYQIELDSDDITSPLHISSEFKSNRYQSGVGDDLPQHRLPVHPRNQKRNPPPHSLYQDDSKSKIQLDDDSPKRLSLSKRGGISTTKTGESSRNLDNNFLQSQAQSQVPVEAEEKFRNTFRLLRKNNPKDEETDLPPSGRQRWSLDRRSEKKNEPAAGASSGGGGGGTSGRPLSMRNLRTSPSPSPLNNLKK